MAFVLTTGSTLMCGSKGTVTLASGSLLRVDGAAVLVEGDVVNAKVVGCTASPSPCKTVSSVITGQATKLTVGGRPVLLDTLAGITSGTDGTLSASIVGQARLEAV